MKISDFSAILFDKDGTILDSENISADAWVFGASQQGQHFSREDFIEFVGIPTDDCYRIIKQKFGHGFDIQRFISDTRAYIDTEKIKGLPVKTGFSEFFDTVYQLNIPLGLVTSAGKKSTISSMQHLNILEKFQVIITVDDVTKPKPAPEPYIKACQLINVSPENTLVFEDSVVGLKASIRAGCKTIAIPDMMIIDKRLEIECYAVLPNFSHISQIFSIS